MKKLIRILIAGFAMGGILAAIQTYSGEPINWIPSMIGFTISVLASFAFINLHLPGGNGAYRAAVIMSSWLLLGVLAGVLMGGGPVTPLSLIAGVSLVGLGAVMMWPVTIVLILVYLIADFVIERR